MEQFIGCDAHKKYSYSVFVAVNERGEASRAVRVDHERQPYRQFLERLPAGSQIALEAGGHYYWMVDEMEYAGHNPRLVHPLEAKKRMGKRIGHPTAQRNLARGVDSTGGTARSARAAASSNVSGPATHALQEPDSCSAGSLQHSA